MSEEAHDVLDGAIPPPRNPNLFGHQAAEAFLARSYQSGKGHHAILIEGPEGIGKSTLAFRFANHVLTHPDPATAPDHMVAPDLDAPVTRQIASGASHNLLHLTRPVDAKSGKLKTAITVDEVRRAGHFFAQTSGTGNWRIVIIDPADDLPMPSSRSSRSRRGGRCSWCCPMRRGNCFQPSGPAACRCGCLRSVTRISPAQWQHSACRSKEGGRRRRCLPCRREACRRH